ncbi:MAG: glycosyltransferase family 2 protein [Chloroflexota bacterium]|nr:glycosyltransferase family 2 protein [Chloroflexota bacterium]
MNTPPTIALVTPSFNQAAYLGRTLNSVIGQGYPHLEYVVMDGASTDGSVALIEAAAHALHAWESQPDGGQADAINRGFACTSGEIMGWLNSDDVLLPDCLHTIGDIFAQFPQIMWITGLGLTIDAADRVIQTRTPFGYFKPLIRHGWYHGRGLGFVRQEGTFWRRALWEQAGGYVDEPRHMSMDYDLWRRFAVYADLVTVEQPLAAYRVHDLQKTADLSRYYAEIGTRLPSWTRAITLPMRAVLTPLVFPLSPRLTWDGTRSRWQFHPGATFERAF